MPGCALRLTSRRYAIGYICTVCPDVNFVSGHESRLCRSMYSISLKQVSYFRLADDDRVEVHPVLTYL